MFMTRTRTEVALQRILSSTDYCPPVAKPIRGIGFSNNRSPPASALWLSVRLRGCQNAVNPVRTRRQPVPRLVPAKRSLKC